MPAKNAVEQLWEQGLRTTPLDTDERTHLEQLTTYTQRLIAIFGMRLKMYGLSVLPRDAYLTDPLTIFGLKRAYLSAATLRRHMREAQLATTYNALHELFARTQPPGSA